MYLSLNDKVAICGAVEFHGKMRPTVLFGKSSNHIEVPEFGIRNLAISSDGRAFDFPLDEDSSDKAHSSSPGLSARLSNPLWLINDSYHWRKLSKFRSGSMLCTGYDEKSHRLYLFDNDSLYLKDFTGYALSSYRTANDCPVGITCATNFAWEARLYSYEVHRSSRSRTGSTVARLDLDGLSWTSVGESSLPMQMHHHCEWLDTVGRRLLVFGGFGNQKYNGDFYSLDLESGLWSKLDKPQGDEIYPRYFSSMGYSDGKLYIFGGMGNECGDQLVGKEYLYDCFEIDLATWTSRKLWSADWGDEDCVAVRGMVIPGNGHFYTLCYPESKTQSQLCMYEFSIADGSYRKLADEVPIFSDKITTNANLYYDRVLEKMILTVEESPDDLSSTVTVYELAYPPLKAKIPTIVRRKTIRYGVIAVLALAVLAPLGLCWKSYRRKKLLRKKKADYLCAPEDRKNSIMMFGSFTAIDRDGNDLSAKFTSKLLNLFYVLISNMELGGISSQRLSGIMWPDKDEDQTKNIRGVTINSLRRILASFDGISIVFAQKKFNLEITDGFYSDYLDFYKITSEHKPDMDRMVSMLARGNFMQNETDPLFDQMRSKAERVVTSQIEPEMKRRFALHQYRNTITCANILFGVDPLDENALLYTVKSLVITDKEEEAKIRYKAFISQYKKEYGEDYGTSFDDLKTA